MWLKKLSHKKKQFLLVGIMLAAISIVFCTWIEFTTELKEYANNRFSEVYCPDVYVYSQGNVNPKDNFSNDYSNIKEISSVTGKIVTAPMSHNNTTISSITNMMCTLNDNNFRKYMSIVEGDKTQSSPEEGEIWIAKTLASSYNIKIGDSLTINYNEPINFKVTAIYTATFAPSERLTIVANIVNKKSIEKFYQEEDAGILALNLYDKSEEEIAKLAMENKYSVQTFSRDKEKSYITDISGVVGGVSAIAALIVFLAALFIIRFIINNDLRKEIRSIGIYKSLGYSSKYIMGIYLKSYMFVGIIGITLGSILAIPIAQHLGVSTTQVLGGFKLTGTSILVCIGTIILLMCILWAGTMICLSRVKKITPVEALSSMQDSGEERYINSVIKNAKGPLATAINDIFKHRKTSIVTTLVLIVSIYLILFFASSYYTCSNIYENANKWIACPKFNTIVTGSITDKLVEDINNSKYVKSEICGNFFYYPPAVLPQYNGNSRDIEFLVLDNLEEKNTGIEIKKGSTPSRSEEIAVTDTFLKELNLQIGDYLKIGIKGQREDEFLITGTFSSMEGKSILMSVDGMKKIDETYEPDNCFITLNNQSDFDQFKSYIENQNSEIAVNKEWVAVKSAVLAIETMLTSIMKIMLIVFIVFVVISVVNVLALTINSKMKQYGILKSLGFGTEYMIEQNICYVLTLLSVSIVIAAILHLVLSKAIFAMIVIDVLSNSISLSVILILGIVLLIIAVTIMLSLPICKVTPVDLMEE